MKIPLLVTVILIVGITPLATAMQRSTEIEALAQVQISPPAPGSAPQIYADATAYKLESAKAAYISMKVFEGHHRLVNDPSVRTTLSYKSGLEESYREAQYFAEGADYSAISSAINRGLDVLKSVGGLTGTIASSLKGANELGRWASSRMPTTPDLTFEQVARWNAIALYNSSAETNVGRYFAAAQAHYHPDLNARYPLDLNPTVRMRRREAQHDMFSAEIGIALDKLHLGQRDLRGLQAHQSKLLDKIDHALLEGFGKLTKNSGGVGAAAPAVDEARIRQQSYEEVTGAFGIASALARQSGDANLVRLTQVGGGVAERLVTINEMLAQGRTLPNNPAALTNQYLAVAFLLTNFLNDAQGDQSLQQVMGALQGIQDQLRQMQKLLIALGDFIGDRFEVLDQDLRSFVRTTNDHLRQIETRQVVTS